ncbi:MAG: ABC transporter ATP-binding protein [Candidatus Aminicenantes bacterium]|nr:MAG: ABC transporter ATP-binding protein [Candidatus Aminicenantes bacterium]
MGKVRVTALKDLSLRIPGGTFLGITGPSGSGKSTFLNLLGGLDTPTSGTIKAQGKVVSRMNNEELARYRRIDVGMIFQSFNLISSLPAVENVALPLLFSGVSKKERKQRALEMLNRVGLGHRGSHRPLELSGGEQQRVAIARALVNQPNILLTDEPTGNLDTRTSEEIVHMLADLNKDQSITVIMVSHEERLIKKFANMVIHLRDGELIRKENIE